MPLLMLVPVHLLPEEFLLILQGLAQVPPLLNSFISLSLTHIGCQLLLSPRSLMLWDMPISEVSASSVMALLDKPVSPSDWGLLASRGLAPNPSAQH